MILCDREIRAAVGRGVIRLDPIPDPTCWSPTAVDLRLAPEINLWSRPSVGGVEIAIQPYHPDYNIAALMRDYCRPSRCDGNGFLLTAGAFLLGWTIEKIQLPHRSRLAARVEGKSSLARLGIGVHVTAPTIHAGFGFKPGDEKYPGNPIQLEIWNAGPLDVRLDAGMPVCQLIFEWVDGTPENGYEGRFASQGPTVG